MAYFEKKCALRAMLYVVDEWIPEGFSLKVLTMIEDGSIIYYTC